MKHFNGFSSMAIIYGESLRNNEMIKDITSKMLIKYKQCIDQSIADSYTNELQLTIAFTLSRAGIMFFENTDGGSVDVLYRDYGYAAVENKNKRCGIAWILQDIILEQLLQNYPQIKRAKVKLVDRYSDSSWQSVYMYFRIVIGKFKEL